MKVKYFIRGVGVGMLFTALLLFAVNRNQKVTISDDEIVKRAKEMGMLTQNEVEDARMDASLDKIKNNLEETSPEPDKTIIPAASVEPTKTKEPIKSVKPSISTKPVEKKTESASKSDTVKKNSRNMVSITIQSGMVSSSISKYLYEQGLVQNAEDFNDYLRDSDQATKVRAGEYEIPKGSSYKEIIDILT